MRNKLGVWGLVAVALFFFSTTSVQASWARNFMRVLGFGAVCVTLLSISSHEYDGGVEPEPVKEAMVERVGNGVVKGDRTILSPHFDVARFEATYPNGKSPEFVLFGGKRSVAENFIVNRYKQIASEGAADEWRRKRVLRGNGVHLEISELIVRRDRTDPEFVFLSVSLEGEEKFKMRVKLSVLESGEKLRLVFPSFTMKTSDPATMVANLTLNLYFDRTKGSFYVEYAQGGLSIDTNWGTFPAKSSIGPFTASPLD